VTGSDVKQSGGPDSTSSTLLARVRNRDQAAWDRLVRLYSPLVYRWCRRAGLQEADAADVGQEVFRAVARGVGEFRHDREGDSLRAWLRVITRNKVCDFTRRQADQCNAVGGSDAQHRLEGVAADEATTAAGSEEDDRLLIYRRAVELLLSECEERTRQAFWRVVVERQAPADVAADLGLSLNALYLLKSRLLRRLREEFAGCIDT
jgi:RNA polymerase sigma-70 factor (ECF subfamily)